MQDACPRGPTLGTVIGHKLHEVCYLKCHVHQVKCLVLSEFVCIFVVQSANNNKSADWHLRLKFWFFVNQSFRCKKRFTDKKKQFWINYMLITNGYTNKEIIRASKTKLKTIRSPRRKGTWWGRLKIASSQKSNNLKVDKYQPVFYSFAFKLQMNEHNIR